MKKKDKMEIIVISGAVICLIGLVLISFPRAEPEFNLNEERAKDLLIDFEQQRMNLEWEQQKHGRWIVEILNDFDYNITIASLELMGDEQNKSIQQNFTKYLNYYNLLKSMYPESDYIWWIESVIYYWNSTGIVDYDAKNLTKG